MQSAKSQPFCLGLNALTYPSITNSSRCVPGLRIAGLPAGEARFLTNRWANLLRSLRTRSGKQFRLT